MKKDEFLHPENWHGGPTYQLAMVWATSDDRQILNALEALWRGPEISGPWNDPADFPDDTASIEALDREAGLKHFGLLTLENGVEVGCIVFTILEENAANTAGHDWQFIAIYYGMQQRAFDLVESDHMRRDNPWLAQIDEQYLQIAERVYAVAPFMAALIDFEGSAPFGNIQEGLAEIQRYGSGCLMPSSSVQGEPKRAWVGRASGLHWLPPQEQVL